MPTTKTHCQLCEREIKFGAARSGVELIAHHGYQRPGQGWQTASCRGARHRPYETGVDQIPREVAIIKQFIANQESFIETLQAKPPETLLLPKEGPLRWGGEQKSVQRPESFDPATIEHNFKRSIRGTYEREFYTRLVEARGQIRFAKADLPRLVKRYVEWHAKRGRTYTEVPAQPSKYDFDNTVVLEREKAS